MGIFRKQNNKTMAKTVTKSYNDLESQSINIISKGTKIEGDIIAEGDIRIDGELKGNITAKGRLVIGPSGSVNGQISCNNIEVSGIVNGKINASELLTMKSMAKIFGDIITKKLSVEPGSVFTGSCKMSDNSAVGSQADASKKSK